MDKQLLSILEFAESIGVSERFAKILVQRGAVTSVKIGSRRLVPASAVRDYVASLIAEAQGERVGAA